MELPGTNPAAQAQDFSRGKDIVVRFSCFRFEMNVIARDKRIKIIREILTTEEEYVKVS